MSDFNLKDLNVLLQAFGEIETRACGLVLSQEAFNTVRAKLVELPEPADTRAMPLLVKPGQKISCLAFYDLQKMRKYLEPHWPADNTDL